MAAYDYVDYAVANGLAEVTLDRPDVLNAFHEPMIEEIVAALDAAQDDHRVYAIVLTGRGRGFCSGADVSDMGDERSMAASTRLWKVQNVVRRLYFGRKPSVAAINGPALGAGSDFALACDLRVMAESAFLREQFVNIGLVPGDGGGWLLPRLVGEAKAKEFLLTGRDITPEAAEELGLVVDVVEDDAVVDAARELAWELRDKPKTALRNTKALVDATQSYEDYAGAAIVAQEEATDDPEHTEAVTALREGREPDYDREY